MQFLRCMFSVDKSVCTANCHEPLGCLLASDLLQASCFDKQCQSRSTNNRHMSKETCCMLMLLLAYYFLHDHQRPSAVVTVWHWVHSMCYHCNGVLEWCHKHTWAARVTHLKSFVDCILGLSIPCPAPSCKLWAPM